MESNVHRELIQPSIKTVSLTAVKQSQIKWGVLGLVALLIGFFAQKALAEENLYEKNYKAQSTYPLKSMQAKPETKMYVSNHYDEDAISMLEDNFDMMGTSGFEAGDVPSTQALSHAQEIKADVVLVYSKYGSTRTNSGKMELIREAAKTGKELTEKDVADAPVNYRYYATYWAKMPTPLLGVHIIKLTPKSNDLSEDEVAAASKGLKVLAVIKDSPAAKAGLKRGDVILKIADKEINDPAVLSSEVGQHQGEKVAIAFTREGEQLMSEATINKY
jgi:hypothetical protein